MREAATTTKLRVVYDESARATPDAPLLNDCFKNPGPPLQNHLWEVLVRERLFPIALMGDIQKAFLQIRVREAERDAMRFYWKEDGELRSYCFTRVLFGLTCSPFLLNGVLSAHLDTWSESNLIPAKELRNSLYVDIISGATIVAEATAKKLSYENPQRCRIYTAQVELKLC